MTGDSVLDVAVSAARAGGEILERYWRSLPGGSISEKRKNDFVTHADRESEEAIVAKIREVHPDDGFLGEEGGRRGPGAEARTWIIDPLDGTTNFIAGFRSGASRWPPGSGERSWRASCGIPCAASSTRPSAAPALS